MITNTRPRPEIVSDRGGRFDVDMIMRSLKSRVGSCRGFTLLEIVVSIAVVSLILGVVISRMDTMLEWDMKKASGKLASTMRYLYNKAAVEGLYIKLVLDFEEQVYWVEATTDPFVMSTGEEVVASKRGGFFERKPEEGETGEEGEAAEGEVFEEGLEEDYAIKPKKPTFTKVDSYLLKPTKLPGSVFFKDVYVEHEGGAVDSGRVEIYFFPNGMVEHAIVNLRDDDDETNYSLETNPISGRVNIEARYRTREEE